MVKPFMMLIAESFLPLTVLHPYVKYCRQKTVVCLNQEGQLHISLHVGLREEEGRMTKEEERRRKEEIIGAIINLIVVIGGKGLVCKE